jgi:hypothetical protein
MSHAAILSRLPAQSPFGRFFRLITGMLDRIALIAARNGDVPYMGL